MLPQKPGCRASVTASFIFLEGILQELPPKVDQRVIQELCKGVSILGLRNGVFHPVENFKKLWCNF